MEKLEGESRGYHVAIFAYSNNIISGEPLIKVYVGTGAGMLHTTHFILTLGNYYNFSLHYRHTQTATNCSDSSCSFHTHHSDGCHR